MTFGFCSSSHTCNFPLLWTDNHTDILQHCFLVYYSVTPLLNLQRETYSLMIPKLMTLYWFKTIQHKLCSPIPELITLISCFFSDSNLTIQCDLCSQWTTLKELVIQWIKSSVISVISVVRFPNEWPADSWTDSIELVLCSESESYSANSVVQFTN